MSLLMELTYDFTSCGQITASGRDSFPLSVIAPLDPIDTMAPLTAAAERKAARAANASGGPNVGTLPNPGATNASQQQQPGPVQQQVDVLWHFDSIQDCAAYQSRAALPLC